MPSFLGWGRGGDCAVGAAWRVRLESALLGVDDDDARTLPRAQPRFRRSPCHIASVGFGLILLAVVTHLGSRTAVTLRPGASGVTALDCAADTGGTCNLLSCYNDRGPTDCIHGKCLCKAGFCNNFGKCQNKKPSCQKDTGGTCRFIGCRLSRGPTDCISGSCICRGSLCSTDGVCMDYSHCGQFVMGSSCRVLPCSYNRGPAHCDQQHCKCSPGFCAHAGTCSLKVPKLVADVFEVSARHPSFPGSHGAVSTALCFSGGGSRSLSLTMGALRALEHLGLMSSVDAISAVSGGTWASAIYMFARRDAKELLGKSTYDSLSMLTFQNLMQTPPPLGAVATTSCLGILKHLVEVGTEPEDLWKEYVSRMALKPFELDSRDKFLAASIEDVVRIRKNNPVLKDFEFLTPKLGRPKVFVMGATILAPLHYMADGKSAVSLQMSPDLIGSPFYPNNASIASYRPTDSVIHPDTPTEHFLVGGGFVESFAFGSLAPVDESAGKNKELRGPRLPFTLADAVGISSLAPAQSLQKYRPMAGLNAQVAIWPVTRDASVNVPAETFEVGDGGNTENAGVLAMLQRQATRIAWFINTDVGLSPRVDFCKLEVGQAWDPQGKVTNQLFDKFGYGRDSSDGYLINNQVFAKDELSALLCELQRLKLAGEPTVYKKRLRVMRNTWWGIEGGFDVDIIFVYNEYCVDFVRHLPLSTRLLLRSVRDGKVAAGPFRNYPFFKTTFQTSSLEPTKLRSSQVNLLAAQSEYFVRQNEAMFRQLLQRADVPNMKY